VASNETINQNAGPGHTLFSTFSAVCWLFGKELSLQLSPTGEVPLGLISNNWGGTKGAAKDLSLSLSLSLSLCPSNNWGGTKVEVWTPAKSYAACNRTDAAEGPMYNAMILPYAEVGFSPLFLRFSVGKCRKCPFFRAFY